MKATNDKYKSVLDDVFHRPEKEVKRFVGILSADVEEHIDKSRPGAPSSFKEKLQTGEPEKMAIARLLTQQAGAVIMQHGWDHEDYVWHVEPAPRKRWASSEDRAIYAMAKTMKDFVPDHIYVKIFRPVASWEVKVFTFKALGLKRCWNVQQDDINRLNAKLFTVLNALI